MENTVSYRVLEKISVPTDFMPADDGKVLYVMSVKEMDAISNQEVRQMKHLFLKLIEAMKLPDPNDGKAFQKGKIVAFIDTQTSIADVEFQVLKFQGDLWGSVEEQYQDLKDLEFQLMEEVAKIANEFDAESSSDGAALEMNEKLEEIKSKSCLIRDEASLKKIESLGLCAPNTDQPLITNLTSSRIKQISQIASFDFYQECYKANIIGIQKSTAEIEIEDTNGYTRKLLIPLSFGNKNHSAMFCAHLLASRPFDISFSNLEQLNAGNGKNRKITPKEVFFSFGKGEAMEIYEANLNHNNDPQSDLFLEPIESQAS
ncbi:hypothetical protein [Thiomicrorhabdus sediminis]|uniref:Uncharacterized protein n=1 Tax=Thiomicrorhabdus sediminis TaxID=2580412 RepID=A0A4P9K9G8_9GAMM|nr:hypothetical protein [Thiomicrorhabdus sediminis]QCU90977.1 hypothetical protein FE785_10240 [Thiomicrorhabdus sediminis]